MGNASCAFMFYSPSVKSHACVRGLCIPRLSLSPELQLALCHWHPCVMAGTGTKQDRTGQAWKQFNRVAGLLWWCSAGCFGVTIAARVANRTLVCETTGLCFCDLGPWKAAISSHSGGIGLETWTPRESGSTLPCSLSAHTDIQALVFGVSQKEMLAVMSLFLHAPCLSDFSVAMTKLHDHGSF